MSKNRLSQRAAGAVLVLLACAVLPLWSLEARRQTPAKAAPPTGRPGNVAAPAGPKLTVPPGFSAREVYPAAQAGSIVNLTFDPDGQLVVAKEQGPIVRLRDANGDGVYDTEQIITGAITNCQGLLFAGSDLLATCDGPEKPTIASLYRVPDANGDGVGEAPILVARSTFSISEHGAHALVFGPDGDVYWIIGNFGGVEASFAPQSPFMNFGEEQLLPVMGDARGHGNQVRAPAGFISRLPLAGILAATPTRPLTDIAIVAGGFRNAYDAAFNLAGELFTFDSDMEWDIQLPWYRPVRTLHLIPGADYGFRYGSGPFPTVYPDTLPSLSEMGRGSPVGIAFYQGEAFPEDYRDAFLLGDWSRGRILVGRQQRTGASYTETISDFVLGTPLNVTDLDVGPDGAVYFSLGGRRTRGGLYRVWHDAAAKARPAPPSDPIARALAQPQPRSAYGRKAIEDARRAAGANWDRGLRAIVDAAGQPGARRARALELLRVHGQAADVATLTTLARDTAPEVRAAAALQLGLFRTPEARTPLVVLLRDSDPLVQRRAVEALVRSGVTTAMTPPFDPVADVLPLLGHEDRHLRYAARQLLRRVDRNRWRPAAMALDTFPAASEAQVVLAQTATVSTDVPPLLDRQLALLEKATTPQSSIDVLRAMHLSLIRSAGVRHASRYSAIGKLLVSRYPTGTPQLDREIARTLAYLENSEAIPKMVAYMTAAGTHREDQLFTMYCLRAMKNGWEKAERDAVVKWFLNAQEQKWRGGASFPGYMRDMWKETLTSFPEEERKAAEAAMEPFTPAPIITTTGRPQQLGDDATRLSVQELREYMTLDPMAYTGDAARGEQVFGKALCAACHKHGDLGQEMGPDLTDVAQRFGRNDLLDAILTPSKSISDQWASVEITTRDKKVVAGVIVSEDAEAVVLQPVGAPSVKVPVKDIQSRQTATVSPMPEGLVNALTLREIADLLAFLERAPGN